jgi:hypothetical protein
MIGTSQRREGTRLSNLLERSYRSLRPGWRLIVHDFMLDDDEQGPALGAQWFLTYFASEPDATSFSAAMLSELAVRNGFVNTSSRILIPEITKTSKQLAGVIRASLFLFDQRSIQQRHGESSAGSC